MKVFESMLVFFRKYWTVRMAALLIVLAAGATSGYLINTSTSIMPAELIGHVMRPNAEPINWVEVESVRAARDTARYTVYLAVFTSWAFFASLIAMVLLLRTLNATREANKIAQNAFAEAQDNNALHLQSWLSFGQATVELRSDTHPPRLSVSIPIKNEGRTPVSAICFDFLNAFVSLKKEESFLDLIGENQEILIFTSLNPGVSDSFEFNMKYQLVSESEEIDRFINSEMSFAIMINVRFKDMFTPKDKHRCIGFDSIKASDHESFSVRSEEYGVPDKELFTNKEAAWH